MKKLLVVLSLVLLGCCSYGVAFAADSNTVSSTVVTDKSVPTASAPSINVNNSDVCKSGASASIQTQVLGIASGMTISDLNCERIKLARSLYGMGMKVAAISTLCQDSRIWDSMYMSNTPCPFMGLIGNEAKTAWEKRGQDLIPEGSIIKKRWETQKVAKLKQVAKLKPKKRVRNEDSPKISVKPLGVLALFFLLL